MSTIKFNVNDVLPQLTIVASIVAQKNLLPIYDNVLLKTYGNTLLLTASDNATWLSMKAPLLEAPQEQVSICVDAKKLTQALKGLNGREVSIDVNEETHTIQATYANGKFSLPFLGEEDFVDFAGCEGEAVKKTIESNALINAVYATKFAVANDELRRIMNGIHFDFFKDGLSVCASDGMKLAKYTNSQIRLQDNEDVTSFTLPEKPATILTTILQKSDSEVSVEFDDRSVVVKNDQFRLSAKLIEGRYPDYNRIIPTNNHNKCVVNKEDVLGALTRVMSLNSSQSELLVLHFTPLILTIKCEDIDYSTSAKEDVACQYAGDEITIGFKGSMLIQTIKNIPSDEVEIALSDQSHAGLFQPHTTNSEDTEQYLSLQMPMLMNS